MESFEYIYYKISDIIDVEINSTNPFIIANEYIKSKNEIGRYYSIFKSFDDFLKNRNFFKHSHEILIDHKNKDPDISGRLVFDFDIKITDIHPDFKKQIENTIYNVIDYYFHDVDSEAFVFIWSTSPNPNKTSKHLTVKNLCFDNWIKLSKIFYQLFCIEWDKLFFWIPAKSLIDFQIVRKKASLRMVGSSKINGSTLILDNPKHDFVDSLIRNYQGQDKQIISLTNINDNVLENVINFPEETEKNIRISSNINGEFSEHPLEVYKKAFEIYTASYPKIFKMGKIYGQYLTLLRIKKGKCILSGKIHENENSFLHIIIEASLYSIYFGCFRKCSKFKKNLGYLTIPHLIYIANSI